MTDMPVSASPMRQLHLLVPLVERQHALIEELRAVAPRSLTAAELGRRLGVSSRTVERDVERLRAAGVAIVVGRGPGGGYRIDARRELPPVSFTPGEAAAIVASLAAVGPYSSPAAQRVLEKLTSAMGPG